MFPLPFTFSFVILFIAFLISKLQYRPTYMLIALYSILGPMQQAIIILSCYKMIQNQNYQIIKILLYTSLSVIAFTNILAYIIQKRILKADKYFQKYLNKKVKSQDCLSNQVCFSFISWLSIILSYKFKMIIFSRIFNLDIMKCKLQSKQKFKIFDFMSLIGLISQILSLYCFGNIISQQQINATDRLMLIDFIIIVTLNIIFSVAIVKKDKDFFQEQIDGIRINKVHNVGEETFQSGLALQSAFSKQTIFLPDIVQQDQYVFTLESKRKKPRNQKDKQIKEQQQQQNCSSSSIIGKYSQQNTNQIQIYQNVDEVIRQYETIVSRIQNNGNIFQINEQFGKSQTQSNNQTVMKEQNVYVNGQLKIQVPIQLSIPDQSIHFQFKYPASQQIEIQNTGNYNQNKKEQQQIKNSSSKYKRKKKNIKTHTKLSDYLNQFSKQQLKEDQINQKKLPIKYDYIDPQGQNIDQREKINIKINQIQLIDSEASQICQKYDIIKSLQNKIQKDFYTQKQFISQIYHKDMLNNKDLYIQRKQGLFNRPRTSKNSPKKVIKEDSQQIYKSNIINFHLNQNHAQNPIKNKSKQKLNIHQNHPINIVQSSHPLRSKTSVPTQTRVNQFYIDTCDEQSQYTAKLRHQNNRKVNKNMSKIDKIYYKTEQNLYKKTDQNDHQDKVKRNSFPQAQQYECKTQFYQQYLMQSQSIFKRTMTKNKSLFPQQKRTQNILSQQIQFCQKDQVPRKPISLNEKNKQLSEFFINKKSLDSQIKPQKPIVKFTAKYSSLDKCKTIQDIKKHKISMKKSSLEKIYLQNLQKMIQSKK